MKPEITQAEFAKYCAEGNTMIWQYKTLYQIEFSRALGKGEYYLRQIHRNPKSDYLGVTRPGRYFAMTPEDANSFRK